MNRTSGPYWNWPSNNLSVFSGQCLSLRRQVSKEILNSTSSQITIYAIHCKNFPPTSHRYAARWRHMGPISLLLIISNIIHSKLSQEHSKTVCLQTTAMQSNCSPQFSAVSTVYYRASSTATRNTVCQVRSHWLCVINILLFLNKMYLL